MDYQRNNDQGCAVVFWIIVAWLFFCGLCSSVLGSIPKPDNIVRDRFDMIEVNHFYSEWGSRVFVQLIFWDWDGRNSQFKCQGWVMMDDALVMTEEGKKKHDQMVEKACEGKGWQYAAELRKNLKYKGDFVGGKLYPLRNYRSRTWTTRYFDGNIHREITASIFRETHTQFDPERKNRELYEESTRRGLTKPK